MNSHLIQHSRLTLFYIFNIDALQSVHLAWLKSYAQLFGLSQVKVAPMLWHNQDHSAVLDIECKASVVLVRLSLQALTSNQRQGWSALWHQVSGQNRQTIQQHQQLSLIGITTVCSGTTTNDLLPSTWQNIPSYPLPQQKPVSLCIPAGILWQFAQSGQMPYQHWYGIVTQGLEQRNLLETKLLYHAGFWLGELARFQLYRLWSAKNKGSGSQLDQWLDRYLAWIRPLTRPDQPQELIDQLETRWHRRSLSLQ